MKTFKKENIYLDLSKLSVEEIKEVLELIIETDDIIEETLKDLNKGRYTDGFRYLFRSPSGWNQNDYRLENRTEITLSEFRQLFSKGEEVLQVDIYSGELNTERILTYKKLSEKYNIQESTVRDIFNAGAEWVINFKSNQ